MTKQSGSISLLSTNNTYVDLGANDLTVTGTVTNGTATSYTNSKYRCFNFKWGR
ncbi:MAG: hypothetical protein IPL04_10420 [Chitinophagaceae bacterium]|nr:hypothetical protein [Chitinophagaceae bacterium]